MKNIKFIHFLTISASILILWGCSDWNNPDDDEINQDLWKIGETTYHNVYETNSAIIFDESTGYSFRFPYGADGVLEVGEIKSGPEAPFEGEMIYVDYDGEDIIELMIPLEDESYTYVMGYGSDFGSFSDENGYDDHWQGLCPIDTVDGIGVFVLMMPFDENLKSTQRNGWKGYNHYYVSKLSSSSTFAANMSDFQCQVVDYANNIIDSLNGTLKSTVNQKWLTSHQPKFLFDGNYYKGFFYLPGKYMILPRISVSEDANFENIAHETGHYMHHLIAGDAAFKTIFESIPSGEHGPAVLHDGRITIGEDYAYFFEYFLTGSVKSWDPTIPRVMFNKENPRNVDFPSLEGFGCAFLASLQQKNKSILDFETGLSVDMPVVGLSFSDIFGLISLGATNINELRSDVETYLSGSSETDKLTVILHRLGWRYMGHLKVVNQVGDPMPAVDVKFVAKVAGYPDYVEEIKTTDDEGNVEFSRCFGGNSYLRVIHDGDSTDVPIVISWAHPTNKPVELGEVAVTSLDLSIFTHAYVLLRCNFFMENDEGNGSETTYTMGNDYSAYGDFPLLGTFYNNTFEGSVDAYIANEHLEGEIVATMNTVDMLLSFEYKGKVTNVDGSRIRTYSFSINEVPVEHANSILGGYIGGKALCDYISEIEYRVDYTEHWEEMIDYHCDETYFTSGPYMRIRFSQ